jgi:MFS-type transporter involved in bile tolerance (Atg22 family)
MDLGPDYLGMATRMEMFSFYLFAVASAGFTAIGGLYGGPFITLLAAGANVNGVVSLGVRYDSYIQLVSLVSVVVGIVTFFTVSPMADYGSLRKVGLMLCTITSVLFVQLVWMCSPDVIEPDVVYQVAALLFIVAVVSMGLVGVWYSAYLPILARNHFRLMEQHRITAGDLLS